MTDKISKESGRVKSLKEKGFRAHHSRVNISFLSYDFFAILPFCHFTYQSKRLSNVVHVT